MTLSKHITDFLEYLEVEKNASQLTIRNYDHYLKRFLGFAGDVDPKDITYELVRKYRVFLARWVDENSGLPLKKITQNYFIIALRAFLRYLAKHDIETLAAEKVELGDNEPRPIKVLDPEHLERLLSAPNIEKIEGLRDKAILEVLFSTGLRVSELAGLDRDHVNIDKGEFGVIGKGRKERIVFLSDSSKEWLGRYIAQRKDLFKPIFIRYSGKEDPSKGGEKMRLTTRSIERILEKYVRQAHIPIKATPHTLRHSFATDLLINGADIRSVQEMLGHANISTTQIYTHITNKQLKDVHKAFHSGNKLD
ncbi:MAG: tyrosine-type recombinase/integrase [bacterium]|nr:tyrosine-type recombinase/integrase [bacterium]